MSRSPEKLQEGSSLAVVGGGVAGIVSAHLLQRRYRVTLFEANDYLGGHTHTIVIPDGPDAGTPVDTGFIVLNDQTYPHFTRFLEDLGVSTRDSEMSFGFHCRHSGLTYAGSGLNGLFAQRGNLWRPAFWIMLRDIARFGSRSRRMLREDSVPRITLGQLLDRGQYGRGMREDYILPMASAIWSTPADSIEDFPAEPFLRFFDNHGLLSLKDRPQWRTVVGGSHTYVKAFRDRFRGAVRLNNPVNEVRRGSAGVSLTTADGDRGEFDGVVIAAHADQALSMLADPDQDESRLLGCWRYQANRTVLHTDPSVLPPLKRAWASWNYVRDRAEEGRGQVSVTYYMNRLQGLDTDGHYCVSLNLRTPPHPGTVVAEMTYYHPTYSFPAMESQGELKGINGRRNTFFCGSYFGYGFHEDAVRSAVDVARLLGGDL